MGEEKKRAIADGVKDLEIKRLEEQKAKAEEEKSILIQAYSMIKDSLNEVITRHNHEKAAWRQKESSLLAKIELEKKCADRWSKDNVSMLTKVASVQKSGIVMSGLLLVLTTFSVALMFQKGLSVIVPLSLGVGGLATTFLSVLLGGVSRE